MLRRIFVTYEGDITVDCRCRIYSFDERGGIRIVVAMLIEAHSVVLVKAHDGTIFR